LDQHIEDLAFGVDGSPKVDHSAVDFQIDSSRCKVVAASGDAVASRQRSSVRNGSPNAEPSHRTPPLRVPPTSLRRRAV
jgi:hypothetical protein